jgi:hypothetical protein
MASSSVASGEAPTATQSLPGNDGSGAVSNPAPKEGEKPAVGHWAWDLFVVLVLTPIIAAITRPALGEGGNEILNHILAFVASALFGFVLVMIFKGWLQSALEGGWRQFSATADATVFEQCRNASVKLAEASLTLPDLVKDVRAKMESQAPQFEKALTLACGESYELFAALETLRHRVGAELIAEFHKDHTLSVKEGCLLLTMRGYLNFLENMLSDEHTQLVCLNKTLPLTWFATVSDGDDFLPGYTALACGYRDRITRITLLQDKGELLNQFRSARHRLETAEDDPDRITRWMMSLALPVLSTGLCPEAEADGAGIISEFFALDTLLTNSLTEIAASLYVTPDATPPRNGVNMPGQAIDRLLAEKPEFKEKVQGYVARVAADDDAMSAWSDCINKAFALLMSESGSHWGIRSSLVEIVQLEQLKALIDRHSEVGVFATRAGPLAFHAKGDLYAGVVIRVLAEAAEIETELRRIAATSTAGTSSVLGRFGT